MILYLRRLPSCDFTVVVFIGRFLSDNVHNRVFECLLVLTESILFPSVVHEFTVELVPHHAGLKEVVASFVVRLLLKLK